MKGFRVTIKNFDLSYLEEVLRIERASFKYPWNKPSFIWYYLENPDGFLIATINDDVVGYIIAEVQRDLYGKAIGHIANLAVDPKYRGRGIGKTLLQHLLNRFVSKGITRVYLEVSKSNEIAKRLYKAYGFKEEGVIRGYYRDGDDAVVMVKNLGNT